MSVDFDKALEEIELLKSELGYNIAPKRTNKETKKKNSNDLIEPNLTLQEIQREANSLHSKKDPVSIVKNIKDKKERKKLLKELKRNKKDEAKIKD